MLSNLSRVERLEDLFRLRGEGGRPCFWCHCEDAPDVKCAHRGWLPLRHEDALRQLTPYNGRTVHA